jgi:hypothetical protein
MYADDDTTLRKIRLLVSSLRDKGLRVAIKAAIISANMKVLRS